MIEGPIYAHISNFELASMVSSAARFLLPLCAVLLLYDFLVRRFYQDDGTMCRKCGRRLRALTEPRCPKCGEVL